MHSMYSYHVLKKSKTGQNKIYKNNTLRQKIIYDIQLPLRMQTENKVSETRQSRRRRKMLFKMGQVSIPLRTLG